MRSVKETKALMLRAILIVGGVYPAGVRAGRFIDQLKDKINQMQGRRTFLLSPMSVREMVKRTQMSH